MFLYVFAVRQSLRGKGGTLEFDECLKEFAVFLKYARREFMKKKNWKLSIEEAAERCPGIYMILALFLAPFWDHFGSIFDYLSIFCRFLFWDALLTWFSLIFIDLSYQTGAC